MARKIDENGFMTFENVLISREGVFDYSGEQIDGEGKTLEPKAIYKVYRPKSAVCAKSFVDSLERKPLIDDHTMIGKDGMPPEEKGTHGVLTDVKVVGNELHGTITVWSESLKEKIRKGKRELSLGYTGRFRHSPGMFMGQRYDFVQYDLSANHIALVDAARMGHSCRIMDQSVFISDSLELPEKSTTELPNMPDDKKTETSCCDEIIEKLKGCSDEDVAKVKDYLSGLEEKKPGEDKCDTPDDGEKKESEDKKSEDNPSEDDKKSEEEDKGEVKDSDKVLGDKKEDDKPADGEGKDCGDKKEEEPEKTDCGDKKAVADAAIAEYKDMLEMANSKEFVKCFGNVSLDGINTKQELAEKVCMMDSALKFVSPDKALDALKGRLAKVGKDDGERVTIKDGADKVSNFDFVLAFQSRK